MKAERKKQERRQGIEVSWVKKKKRGGSWVSQQLRNEKQKYGGKDNGVS